MDTFKQLVCNFDIATMTPGDFKIPGDFSGYYGLTLSVECDSLDNTDAVVSFLQRVDSTATWKVPTGLSSILTNASYTDELTNGAFGSCELGYRIAVNSCKSGTIRIWAIGKID